MFERLDAAPSLSDRVAQTLMDKIDAAADAMMMGDADNGTQMVQGVGRPV